MIFFLVMMIVSAVYTPWQIEDGIESAIDQSPLIERLVYRIVLFTVLDILSVIEYIDTISDSNFGMAYLFWVMLFFSIQKTILDKVFYDIKDDLNKIEGVVAQFCLDNAIFSVVLILCYHFLPQLINTVGNNMSDILVIVIAIIFIALGGVASTVYIIFCFMFPVFVVGEIFPNIESMLGSAAWAAPFVYLIAAVVVAIVVEILGEKCYRAMLRLTLKVVPFLEPVYSFFYEFLDD